MLNWGLYWKCCFPFSLVRFFSLPVSTLLLFQLQTAKNPNVRNHTKSVTTPDQTKKSRIKKLVVVIKSTIGSPQVQLRTIPLIHFQTRRSILVFIFIVRHSIWVKTVQLNS